MRQKGFVFALISLLAFSGPSFADAYEDAAKTDSFYAEILEAAKTRQGLNIIRFFEEGMDKDVKNVHAISIWLRDHSIRQTDAEQVNALYFMSYSDIIFLLANAYKGDEMARERKALAQTAMMNLYAYEALAFADAARCADKTAFSAIAMNTLEERYGSPDVQESFEIFSKEDFDIFAEVALATEEKFAGRPANSDLCGMGMAKMEDMLKQPGTEKKEIDDPAFVGGKRTEVIAPEGYTYEPDYISDADWQEMRVQVRETLPMIWSDRYSKMTSPNLEKPKP